MLTLRPAAPIVLVLLLPGLAAQAPVHVDDPAGDQQFDAPYLAQQGIASDLCEDPTSDVVDLRATATSTAIKLEFAFADALAPVRCGALDMPALPHVDGFPYQRVWLTPEDSGSAISVLSSRDESGVVTHCIRYSASYTRCVEASTPWIEVATVAVGSEGETYDLRGRDYALAALAMDSYGLSTPKSNLMIFWDPIARTPGFPLRVPT